MGINIENSIITIRNEYICRIIDISQGLVTTSFSIRPGGGNSGDAWYPVFAFESGVPFEAAISINEITYEAGPWKHKYGWNREGAFSVKHLEKKRSDFGEVLQIYCVGRDSFVPQIELVIEYEIYDSLPLLTKCVKIINVSSSDIVVDNVTVDILRFFDGKLALTIFSDYYRDIGKADDYYFTWTRVEFPEKIAMHLKSGESFETFKCHEAVTSTDRDEASIILHRIYKKLAPWITKSYVKQIVNSCNSFDELVEFADWASADGIEEVELFVGQLFTNTGDYMLRPDIFPNGEDDLKRLVGYYHKKNIIVLPYCSTTIAWYNSNVCMQHPNWQYLGPDGIRYSPDGLGNMCYQSQWGDYITEKLLYLLDDIGFDGLALDGPYHGQPCLADDHKHKNSAAVMYMNWVWEKKFFTEVIKRGKIITAPQEHQAFLLGMKERPGGYREEDYFVIGGMPLVIMTRACLYEARYRDPSCATWAFCSLEKYHGHSIEVLEENTTTYDHAIGSMFGYGHGGAIFSKTPYTGVNTKKIFTKWVNFFKEHRQTLAGEMVHLAVPNGYEPDAVMHVSLDADPQAVLVVFNPVNKEKDIVLELPLKYTGLKSGDEVEIDGHGNIKLDSRGHCAIRIILEPYEIKTLNIRRFIV